MALTFTISADTEELDKYEEDEEHGDPYANIDRVVPERDGDTSGREFCVTLHQFMQASEIVRATYQKVAR